MPQKTIKKQTSQSQSLKDRWYVLIQTLLWLCSSAQHCVTPCCVWSTEPEAMPQKTIKKQTSQSQSLKDRWVCVNSDSSLALFLGPTLCDPMLCLKHRARGNATKDNKKKKKVKVKVWRIDGYVLIQTLLWLCQPNNVTPCCVWSKEPEAMPQKTIKKQTSQSQSLKDRWVCLNSDSSLALFFGPTLCDPMLCLKHRAEAMPQKTIKKKKSQSQSLKDTWLCVKKDSSLAPFHGPTLWPHAVFEALSLRQCHKRQ